MGRACEIARAVGHDVVGAEHFFLGMLHDRSMPVYVLSEAADLDTLEAAVLEVKNEPPRVPESAG